MQRILKYGGCVSLIVLFVIAPITKAQDSYIWEKPLEEASKSTEYQQNIGGAEGKEKGLVIIIVEIVKDILSLLGVVFVILSVYAGYLWMTAGGNDEQVSKAKALIRDAIIGLIITLSAYAISYYILDNLIKATNEAQESRTGWYLEY
ncbi:MAG: hypothetical protein V1770_02020 [bacterium]